MKNKFEKDNQVLGVESGIKNFNEILDKADDIKFKGIGIKELNKLDNQEIKLLTENDLKSKLESIRKLNLQYPIIYNVNDFSKIENGNLNEPVKNNKLKLKLDMFLEYFNEVRYWFIAEYKIIRRLTFALSKKRNEFKVRKAFEGNIKMFVRKYGYNDGMLRYYRLTKSINSGVLMNKRMVKNNL